MILCDNIFELIQNEFCGEGDMEPLQYGEKLEVILSQNIEKMKKKNHSVKMQELVFKVKKIFIFKS